MGDNMCEWLLRFHYFRNVIGKALDGFKSNLFRIFSQS